MSPEQELDFLLHGAAAAIIASIVVAVAAAVVIYRALYPPDRGPWLSRKDRTERWG